MEIFVQPKLEEKKTRGRKAKHSASFREMVVKNILEDGMTYREASKTFAMSHSSIAALIKNHKQGKLKSNRKTETTHFAREVANSRHQDQLKDLKLLVAELYLENLMLKKMLEHSLTKRKKTSSDITSENLDLLPEPVK